MDILSLISKFQTGEIERKTNEKVGPGLLVFPIASESIKQQKINKIIRNYNFS